ncbi:MAG TPA: EamA family transporter, partial [Polyangiaceae bacterium]
LGAFRFGVAGVALFAIARARGGALPTAREWLSSAVIGTCMMAVGLGTVSVALGAKAVTSGVAALVFGTVPLFTALFERLFGRKLGAREAFGLALGFAGVLLVATKGTLRASPAWSLALIGCAASYSLGCALNVRLPLPKGPIATASQMLVAGVVLALASLVHGERLPEKISLESFIALAHLIVSGSMIAYSALLYLLRTESPALATSYAFVNPVVALFLGAWLGGETVLPSDGVAVLLVIGAVAFVTSAKRSSGRVISART